MLGVKVYTPVRFNSIKEPTSERAWHVSVSPEDHLINDLDFNFIIGANGKNNSLPDFTRKTTRGKLAIAITANFLNKQSTADAKVQEIGGLSFIFDQEFFNGLKEKTGADLENLVYYKDDTHYFVMTPRKSCLLQKGVIIKDNVDCKKLLARENIDPVRLKQFAQEVALGSTNGQLPSTELVHTHRHEDDLAIFDFTSISMANHSCFAQEKHGKVLLQCIVGDSLLEPFWPTGTGCARGFLGVFDCAWLLRSWCTTEDDYKAKLYVIAERESTFRILSQTEPEGQMRIINKYTIDPVSRYGTRIKVKTLIPINNIKHLYVTASSTQYIKSSRQQPKADVKDFMQATPELPIVQAASSIPSEKEQIDRSSITRKRSQGTVNFRQLLTFYQDTLYEFTDLVKITDLSTSWCDGVALCALVQLYRPSLVDVYQMPRDSAAHVLHTAVTLVEQEFGIVPLFSTEDVANSGTVDRLDMYSYLMQIRKAIEKEPEPSSKMPRIETKSHDEFLEDDEEFGSSASPMSVDPQSSSLSPHGMLMKLSSITAVDDLRSSVVKAKAWMKDDKGKETGSSINKNDVIKTILSPPDKPKRRSAISRKKGVKFTDVPKVILKYRESQEIDIGQSIVPASQRGVPETIAEEKGPPLSPFIQSARPSIQHCKGIARAHIKNFQVNDTPKPSKSYQSPTTTKKLPTAASSPAAVPPVIVSKHNTTSVIPSNMMTASSPENIKAQEEKPKTKGIFQKMNLLNFAKRKDKEDDKSGNRTSLFYGDSDDTVEDATTNSSTPRRGLQQVPNKALESVSYVACFNRDNSPRNVFEQGESTEGKTKEQSTPSSSGKYVPAKKADTRFEKTPVLNLSENQPSSNTDRRGLKHVPNKAMESLSYMACLDRTKPDFSTLRQNQGKGEINEKFNESVSTVCCICERKLYLVERHTAHDKFFHKNCYRCATCNILLRHGNSVMKKTPKVQFFCFSHAYTAGVFNVEWEDGDQGARETSTDPPIPVSGAKRDQTDLKQSGLELNLVEEDSLMDTQDDQTSSGEDDSSDDDDDIYDNNITTKARRPVSRLKSLHQSMRSQRSLRLLVADEIQRGLDEIDEDEEKLEKEGHDVEEKLRLKEREGPNDEDLEVWSEVLERKKELVDKESKLMLRKKLVEIQDRYNRIQHQITSLGQSANDDIGFQKEFTLLHSETAELENHVEQLVFSMSSISSFLASDSSY